jgi:hypothetical protein
LINVQPYEKAFSEDLAKAYRERDAARLRAEIKRLCRLISLRDGNFDHSIRYDHDMSRLQVALALLDTLTRRGETIQLICDVVNF